ncbi:MAG: hypothetical protein B6D44_10120 [Ignavibacteriales bacterium UTCHB2]|jgi:hypothetical protein|nr:MAG: hypothetical protein BWY38_02798 [Ignavibacteria bacterium ADurb.Bin266]OQY72424.1 MAG: hypothetical protein B6D44_10120 [Ignavibacteriales bacterium UTCHB2]HQI42222.1 hypothetical protein [Ignavibacteriaceae bacterium]HQJ45521.1 hypothetical protein [Ignavibacteriaceae bacterium]
MNAYKVLFIILISVFITGLNSVFAQEEEEQIRYYQMEPLDDSLFIKIQEALFIDPPDPKAEIIVDVRDANNQTISIKGALYPLLAISPELRARVITYPFKLNLEEDINYGSVFTRVIQKIRISKVAQPPTKLQISPTMGYVNPFFQLQGGERLGLSLKQDVGLSLGIGTPYSGALETNMMEVNFHILGVKAGIFSHIDAMIEAVKSQNHNNLIVSEGFQITYVIPFGNFFEFGYFKATARIGQDRRRRYLETSEETTVLNPDSTVKYQARIIDNQQSFLNWEFRYPVSILASTRGKFYVAQYLDEWHFGFSLREASLAGSTFDLSFDGMPGSKYREPQYNINILVQKIMEGWGFSAFSIGPSASLSRLDSGSFGFTKIFVNLRFKIGTSF